MSQCSQARTDHLSQNLENRSLDLMKGTQRVNVKWEMSFPLIFPHLWLIKHSCDVNWTRRSSASVRLGLCSRRGMSSNCVFDIKLAVKPTDIFHIACLQTDCMLNLYFKMEGIIAPPLNERPYFTHTSGNKALISGWLMHSMLMKY